MAKKSDGEIVISTKLDNSELDKDLEKLDQKIEKKSKKKKKIPVEVEITENKNNDKVLDDVEKKTKKKTTTTKKKTTTTTKKTATKKTAKKTQEPDSKGMLGYTVTMDGHTFYDQKSIDEYLASLDEVEQKTEKINKKTQEINKKPIKIPKEATTQAKQTAEQIEKIKNETQGINQNIKEIPVQKIKQMTEDVEPSIEKTKELKQSFEDLNEQDYIEIPIDINADKFDRQIANLEEKIAKKENQQMRINIDIENIQKAETKYDELVKKSDEYKEQIIKINQEIKLYTLLQNQFVNPKTKRISDFPKYEIYGAQIRKDKEQAEILNAEFEKTNKEIEKWDTKLANNAIRIDKLKQKQSEITSEVRKYKSQIEAIKMQKQQEQLNNMKDGFNTVEKSVGNVISKIGRLVLGMFSVASAYSLITRVSSTLAQYDKQYATNLEYIQYMLAQTLAPVIQWIMKMFQTLLGYINYLAKALFNVTIFSAKSAKNFANAQKSTSKIKKDLQTTSFDEMNVLSDTSSSSGGTEGGGIPTFRPEEVEIPDWLKKMADFLKPIVEWFQKIIDKYGPVKTAIMVVVGALAGFLILKTIANLIKGFGKAFTGVSVDFTGFFNSLGKAVEAIAVLGGIALVLKEVTNLLTAFSESGLSVIEVAELLGVVFGELALAFVAIAGATKLMDWTGVAAAAVILAGFALVINQVTSLIDTFSKSGMEVSDVAKLMASIFGTVVLAMAAMAAIAKLLVSDPLVLVGLLALVAAISAILIVVAKTLPTILDAIGKFINTIAPPLILLIDKIFEGITRVIKALGETLPPIINSVGKLFNTIFNGISKVIKTVGDVIVKILKTVGDLVDSVLSSVLKFIRDLGPAINKFVDSTIWAVTKLVNFVVSAVEYLVNRVVDGINGIAGVLNNLPGVNIRTKGYVSIPRFTPKLATGAILNNPGRGVPVGGGSAVAGEAGKEGILPLTDSQAMETLGEAIGRYITINASITNTMNGRVISRQLQKIQNNSNFAYNN